MDQTDELRKYEPDKIVLLGLFAAGLLIARFITAVRYTGPRKAGGRVVTAIKGRGISSFFKDRQDRSFFLIKDAADRTIGFTADVFAPSAPPDKLNIQSAALLYIRSRYKKKQLVIFQSDDQFNTFSWNTEVVSPSGRAAKEILLAEDGILTVTEAGKNEKQNYAPSSTSIPDVLLDLVFSQMLQADYKKIIVDTINSDGRTIEVVVSQTQTRRPTPFSRQPEYELNVIFLDGRRFSQQVYLDRNKQISAILLKQDRIFLFERATMEDLLREVPEAADYLVETLTISGPNQPQY